MARSDKPNTIEGALVFRGPGASDSPVQFEGEPLAINVDARAIVDVARRTMIRLTRDHIMEGKRPDGGPQRPLSRARAAERGRVSDKRGFRTGHLADEIRSGPIKGTTAKAEARILPPTDRNVFIAMEQKRGVDYIGFSPSIDAAITEAVDEMIELMLDGLKVEADQGEPTAREEAAG